MTNTEIVIRYKEKAGEHFPQVGLTEDQVKRAFKEAAKYVNGEREDPVTFEELAGSTKNRIY